MGSKSKVLRSKNETMSKLSDDEYELHTRCRNTRISRQPEEIQDIRIQDRKDD
jgi:hypothetical protein